MFFDNTVIPSFLGAQERGTSEYEGASGLLTNVALREGEVKKIYPYDHALNISKQHTEYEVNVVHRDGSGVSTTVVYRGVAATSHFGGSADYSHSSYRADSAGSPDVGTGSRVLVLCVSGDQQRAIILGGLEVRKRKSAHSHVYEFEFNGAKFVVNEEGEVQFTHRGPTNHDGSVKDSYEGFEGSFVKFDKRANITVATPATENHESQFVKLTFADPDHPERNNSVEIQAEKNLNLNSSGDTTHTTKNTYSVEAKEGSIELDSANGTHIGAATDSMLLGDTYRQAEALCNQTNSKAFQAAGAAATAAGGMLTTAAPLNAIPMVGGILALPLLLTAAQALTTLGTQLSIAGTSLNTFENQYDRYLSTKNKND
jgi:hypothetical protein